jgi:hypothetical protein
MVLGWVMHSNAHLVAVHQNPDKVATFDIIDSVKGNTVASSSPTFEKNSLVFSWPYAEMTTDPVTKNVYAVFFPDNSNNSILYELNSTLHTQQTFSSTPFWFFDLQFLPQLNSLFGIKVISTYGRAFSRFQLQTTQDMLGATELFTLPYMWYVNASSTDNVRNRYFALLNYFPNQPESTLDQKLLIAQLHPDGSKEVPSFSVLNIAQSTDNQVGIIHFISYSQRVESLFALSLTADASHRAYISTVDIVTGTVKEIFWQFEDVNEIGPLVVDDVNQVMTFFYKPLSSSSSLAKSVEGPLCATWQLVQVPLIKMFSSAAKVLHCYESSEYRIFAAAAKY